MQVSLFLLEDLFLCEVVNCARTYQNTLPITSLFQVKPSVMMRALCFFVSRVFVGTHHPPGHMQCLLNTFIFVVW